MTTENQVILLFMTGGQVQLQIGGHTTWASDNDAEFRDEFEDEFLDPDEDAELIIDYLIDHEHITSEQAENAEVESESLEVDDDAERDIEDEWGEDDDEQDEGD